MVKQKAQEKKNLNFQQKYRERNLKFVCFLCFFLIKAEDVFKTL